MSKVGHSLCFIERKLWNWRRSPLNTIVIIIIIRIMISASSVAKLHSHRTTPTACSLIGAVGPHRCGCNVFSPAFGFIFNAIHYEYCIKNSYIEFIPQDLWTGTNSFSIRHIFVVTDQKSDGSVQQHGTHAVQMPTFACVRGCVFVCVCVVGASRTSAKIKHFRPALNLN